MSIESQIEPQCSLTIQHLTPGGPFGIKIDFFDLNVHQVAEKIAEALNSDSGTFETPKDPSTGVVSFYNLRAPSIILIQATPYYTHSGKIVNPNSVGLKLN